MGALVKSRLGLGIEKLPRFKSLELRAAGGATAGVGDALGVKPPKPGRCCEEFWRTALLGSSLLSRGVMAGGGWFGVVGMKLKPLIDGGGGRASLVAGLVLTGTAVLSEMSDEVRRWLGCRRWA